MPSKPLMWEANPRQPTMPCEAANSFPMRPGKRLGAGICGRSSNIEIHTSPEVACEGYGRVANWDGVLNKQNWLFERKKTVLSKQWGGNTESPLF